MKLYRLYKRWVLTLSIALWFLLFLSSSNQGAEDLWNAFGVIKLPGSGAPDFTLDSLNHGRIRLAELKGKVVLVNFWATWCPPCREEMPSFQRLYKGFKDRGLVVLAVDLMEDREGVGRFAKEFGLTFPLLLDGKGEVFDRYKVFAFIPTTFIIDKEGKAIGKVLGPREWDGEYSKRLIEGLLKR